MVENGFFSEKWVIMTDESNCAAMAQILGFTYLAFRQNVSRMKSEGILVQVKKGYSRLSDTLIAICDKVEYGKVQFSVEETIIK